MSRSIKLIWVPAVAQLSLLLGQASGASLLYPTALEIRFETPGGAKLHTPVPGVRSNDTRNLPAADDPTGNWGLVSEGMQASLRLDKSSYAVGEPIVVTLLIRNISEVRRNVVTWREPRVHFAVLITDNQNQEIMDRGPVSTNEFQRRLKKIITNPRPYPVEPFTQVACIFRLDDAYYLDRPGRYFVSAGAVLGFINNNDWIQARSANAMFNLVAGPNTVPVTNGPVSPQSNTNASTAPTLPPSSTAPPPPASANPAGTDTNTGNATQNQAHTNPTQPASNDVKPGETGTEPSSSPRRNLLWSGALAGLVLFGTLGFWLLRRRRA